VSRWLTGIRDGSFSNRRRWPAARWRWQAQRAAAEGPVRLPHPKNSGIEHIVVVMMENRSSIICSAGYPARMVGKRGCHTWTLAVIHTRRNPLAPYFQGCLHSDPDHSLRGRAASSTTAARATGGSRRFKRRLCHRVLRAERRPSLPPQHQAGPPSIGTSRDPGADIPEPVLHDARRPIVFQHVRASSLPTIWDRWPAAGLSGAITSTMRPFWSVGAEVRLDQPYVRFAFSRRLRGRNAAARVSYWIRGSSRSPTGTTNDDHPHGDIRDGEVVHGTRSIRVTTSPQWKHTVLVFNFDEWGGFRARRAACGADSPASAAAATTAASVRVPSVVVSPFAPRGVVSHTPFDHTSFPAHRMAVASRTADRSRCDGRTILRPRWTSRGPIGRAVYAIPPGSRTASHVR